MRNFPSGHLVTRLMSSAQKRTSRGPPPWSARMRGKRRRAMSGGVFSPGALCIRGRQQGVDEATVPYLAGINISYSRSVYADEPIARVASMRDIQHSNRKFEIAVMLSVTITTSLDRYGIYSLGHFCVRGAFYNEESLSTRSLPTGSKWKNFCVYS